MIDWDKAEPASEPGESAKVTASAEGDTSEIDDVLAEYIRLSQSAEVINSQLSGLKERIAREFPPGIGNFSLMTNRHCTILSRGDRYKWDERKLEEKFSTSVLPPYINRKLSISKAAFMALDAAEQSKLLDALTVTHGATKIEVSPR